MQTVEFAKDFRRLFETSGLSTFADFFNYSEGDTVNINRKRDVVAFSLQTGDGWRDFFMKRFHRPHFKDMLFTLATFGRLCSQAECEWRNAKGLLDNGIETYRPVCYGVETRHGLERRSFFITEKLSGRCLTDYLAEKWAEISPGQKEDIMKAIGRFVRRIHDVRISMPDLYVWHLFITETGDGYEFAIIDLHRMRMNAASRRQIVRNLGAFDFSMLNTYFGDALREAFLEAYMGDDFRGNRALFKWLIANRARKMARRRRRPLY